jgi:hypothetical protein
MPLLSANNRNPFPFSLLCALLGTFAFAGYYSDILKPFIPAWLAVGIFTLPVIVLVFVQRGEVPDRILARAHLAAAALFLILAAGMEAGSFWGHRPKELTLYRIMAHLSWSFAWGGVITDALKRRSRR